MKGSIFLIVYIFFLASMNLMNCYGQRRKKERKIERETGVSVMSMAFLLLLWMGVVSPMVTPPPLTRPWMRMNGEEEGDRRDT